MLSISANYITSYIFISFVFNSNYHFNFPFEFKFTNVFIAIKLI